MGKFTQKTLKYLKEDGFTTAFVEKYVWPVKKKFDMFGIIDIVAIKPGITMGVQSCGLDFASHNRMLLEHENSLKWLEAENQLMLIGWCKVKKVRGGKAMIWKVRIKEYKQSDFQGVNNERIVVENCCTKITFFGKSGLDTCRTEPLIHASRLQGY